MKLKPDCDSLKAYLLPSDSIDFHNPAVSALADELEARSGGGLAYIQTAFEYVRDQIAHSADIGHDAVTCSASEVLQAGHGICFAKSHLLAALLRCKSIPAGLCYQKLILDDETAPVLIFHGLNAVYIAECEKWIRLDARGNKAGVDAQFSLDVERLAFPVRIEKGEADIPIVFAEPDPAILAALRGNRTRTQLWQNLPKELACGERI